jgi:hypothetical protein
VFPVPLIERGGVPIDDIADRQQIGPMLHG